MKLIYKDGKLVNASDVIELAAKLIKAIKVDGEYTDYLEIMLEGYEVREVD